MKRKLETYNLYKYKWIKKNTMKWSYELTIYQFNSSNEYNIILLETGLFSSCNKCKNILIDDKYGDVVCNSRKCCFIRSLSKELPKICYNHKLKNIYKMMEMNLMIPKYIIDIISQYIPLFNMNYDNIYRNHCGYLIKCWRPGYLCNCTNCKLDRLFNQLE